MKNDTKIKLTKEDLQKEFEQKHDIVYISEHTGWSKRTLYTWCTKFGLVPYSRWDEYDHTKPELFVCKRCGTKIANLTEGYCTNCYNTLQLAKQSENIEVSTELGKQIKELFIAGKSYAQIADTLNCSKSTVSYYCSKTTKDKANAKRIRYRETFIGYFVHRLDSFKKRKQGLGKPEKCLDWNKKFRTACSHFRNRFKEKGKEVTNFTYKDALNYIGENPTCYLTGTPINLYEDDYCLDHIIPISKDGTNDLENMGITIPIANTMKSDQTVEELLEMCIKILTWNGYEVQKV